MKYKIFTPNKYIYFYDSESKWFPIHYKYVQYDSELNICYEEICSKNNQFCRIIFDADNNKKQCYQFSKPINKHYSNIYYFDENFDFLKYV